MIVSALAGMITGPKYLTLRTLYQRIFEQRFYQGTDPTYSCSTMQFTGACQRENSKPPLFPGLKGAEVKNLEMVAR